MEKFQHIVQMHFSTACGAVAKVVDHVVREKDAVGGEGAEDKLAVLDELAFGLAVKVLLGQRLERRDDICLGLCDSDTVVGVGVAHHLRAAGRHRVDVREEFLLGIGQRGRAAREEVDEAPEVVRLVEVGAVRVVAREARELFLGLGGVVVLEGRDVAQGLFEVFGELVLRDFGRKGNLRLDETGEFSLVDFSGDILLGEGDDGVAAEVRLVGEG